MILNLEIEQFIKEIEKKRDLLPVEQQNHADNKIQLLTRIQVEFKTLNDNFRQILLINSDSALNELKTMKQLQIEKVKNEVLDNELKEIKSNI